MSSNAGKRLPPSRSRFSLSSARFPHHYSSASTHMSFAATPEPPYYAVIFSSIQRSGALSDYSATAARMLELAAEQPGFLGVESARTEGGWGITVSYWRDREAIRRWRQHAEHLLAQERGRSEWYAGFRLRIAVVEHERAFSAS